MKVSAVICCGLNLGFAATMHGQYSPIAELVNWVVGVWLAFIALEAP